MPNSARAPLEAAIQNIRHALDRLRSATENTVPIKVPNATKETAAEFAQRIYTFRRRRDREIREVSDLFHDPTWDILLDLFIAAEHGKTVSVSSACIASAVPPTTGLRAITVLKERGVVRVQADPFDKRRTFVILSEEFRQKMAALMAEGTR